MVEYRAEVEKEMDGWRGGWRKIKEPGVIPELSYLYFLIKILKLFGVPNNFVFLSQLTDLKEFVSRLRSLRDPTMEVPPSYVRLSTVFRLRGPDQNLKLYIYPVDEYIIYSTSLSKNSCFIS